MQRPSIKVAMVGIFFLLGCLVAAFGYAAISGMRILNEQTEEFSESYLPSVHQAHQIAQARFELGILAANHLLQATQDQKKFAETLVSSQKTKLNEEIKAYEPLITTLHEREIFEKMQAVAKDYDKPLREMMDYSYEGNGQAATGVFATDVKNIADKMTALANDLVKSAMERGQQAHQTSLQVYGSTLNFTFIILLVSLILVAAAAAFAVYAIADPATKITAAMRKLASGDTSVKIPFAGRADEIGAMAAAVEVFRQAAITNARLEEEAETGRNLQEANRIAVQQSAEAAANERLRAATSGIGGGLKRLAAGDLAFQLEEAFAPDFEPLRHDFNQSVQQLGTALSAIVDSISTMDSGTSEIASGAHDLAKRTEQQAASLEETAAALDEITVNVGSSAKLTEEARRVATQANHSAAKSAEVVSDAEDAMRRIEESSQQISNIIGVIDEIAFQTNLLALNAGVEAARAGDAGKGFAVVAQEVRELAQRAARAAKEIKGLIQNSSTEVQSGVKLVRDTRQSLDSIGGLIGQINTHMDAITVAAKEQSVGLSEVNTAVNTMDQVTQQNAAMVEESTAAAATLAQESAKLKQLVAPFKVAAVIRQGSTGPRVYVAEARSPQVDSPARVLGSRVAKAFGGGSQASSVALNDWQEF